jgi:hypothetical protein
MAASPRPVSFPGGADPGGRDDVAGSVAGSVSAAHARYAEHERDTYGQGSARPPSMRAARIPATCPERPASSRKASEPPGFGP